MMPSTSVQISMVSAVSAPPTRAPVKSEPPRPSVVVSARFVRGDEAAHHRDLALADERQKLFLRALLDDVVDVARPFETPNR